MRHHDASVIVAMAAARFVSDIRSSLCEVIIDASLYLGDLAELITIGARYDNARYRSKPLTYNRLRRYPTISLVLAIVDRIATIGQFCRRKLLPFSNLYKVAR